MGARPGALERLRSLSRLDGSANVAASIGVARWRAPMPPADLLRSCDEALLPSKQAGTGRVTGAA